MLHSGGRQRMTVARKRLADLKEAMHGLHQFIEIRMAMIARDRVMQCLPQPLDAVDPRMIGRLEEQPHLRVLGQPTLSEPTAVGRSCPG